MGVFAVIKKISGVREKDAMDRVHTEGFLLKERERKRKEGDGEPVGKSAKVSPEFELHGGRREITPSTFPLTSILSGMCTSPINKYNNSNKYSIGYILNICEKLF